MATNSQENRAGLLGGIANIGRRVWGSMENLVVGEPPRAGEGSEAIDDNLHARAARLAEAEIARHRNERQLAEIRTQNEDKVYDFLMLRTAGMPIDANYEKLCMAYLTEYFDQVQIVNYSLRRQLAEQAFRRHLKDRLENGTPYTHETIQRINEYNSELQGVMCYRPWWGFGFVKEVRLLNPNAAFLGPVITRPKCQSFSIFGLIGTALIGGAVCLGAKYAITKACSALTDSIIIPSLQKLLELPTKTVTDPSPCLNMNLNWSQAASDILESSFVTPSASAALSIVNQWLHRLSGMPITQSASSLIMECAYRL